MKWLVTLLLVGLLALPATADVTIGPGGSITTIRENGKTKDAGNLFAEAEYSVNLDAAGNHWFGLMAAYTGSDFAGLGARYYHPVAGGALFPGGGLSIYQLGPETLSDTKTLVGGELLLEMAPVVGGVSLPLKAFVAWHGSIGWLFRDEAEVSMLRYGLMITPELPQE